MVVEAETTMCDEGQPFDDLAIFTCQRTRELRDREEHPASLRPRRSWRVHDARTSRIAFALARVSPTPEGYVPVEARGWGHSIDGVGSAQRIIWTSVLVVYWFRVGVAVQRNAGYRAQGRSLPTMFRHPDLRITKGHSLFIDGAS